MHTIQTQPLLGSLLHWKAMNIMSLQLAVCQPHALYSENLMKRGHISYFFSLLSAVLAGHPKSQLREQSLSADSTSVTLESLQPDTEYVISLYPLIPRNSASPSILNALRLEAVQQLSVETESEGSVRVRWRAVSGAVLFTFFCLLQPNIEYIVTVIPLYEGNTEGPVATTRFKIGTCGFSSSPNTSLLSVSLSVVRIAWTGVPRATGYKFMRAGLYSLVFCITGAEQSRLLGAEATSYTIDGLQPDEPLVIGVAAVAGQHTGEVLTLSARTNPLTGSVSGLRIVDITSQRIRIEWLLSSRATGYKITWRRDDGKQLLSFSGHLAVSLFRSSCGRRRALISSLPSFCHVLLGAGVETTRTVAADVSSFTIDDLQSDSAYSVLVSTLSDSREGKPSILNVKTGGEERTRLVGGDVTAVDLDELDSGVQYEVQVKALIQNREGNPVSVRVTTRESCVPLFRLYSKVPTSFNDSQRCVDWRK
uniref:Fibronectin type-III domain-containing protein n=1 Tax=Monopterus albus TaxID=43700 RepID=A0A3Q3K687_MONAL